MSPATSAVCSVTYTTTPGVPGSSTTAGTRLPPPAYPLYYDGVPVAGIADGSAAASACPGPLRSPLAAAPANEAPQALQNYERTQIRTFLDTNRKLAITAAVFSAMATAVSVTFIALAFFKVLIGLGIAFTPGLAIGLGVIAGLCFMTCVISSVYAARAAKCRSELREPTQHLPIVEEGFDDYAAVGAGAASYALYDDRGRPLQAVPTSTFGLACPVASDDINDSV